MKTIMLLCLGNVVLRDETLGIAFQEIENDQLTSKKRYFKTKSFKNLFPGAIISIEADETTVEPKTLKYMGRWQDSTLVANLQLETEIAKTHIRQHGMLKRDKQLDTLLEILQPLRRKYYMLDATNKRAFELIILEYLRK